MLIELLLILPLYLIAFVITYHFRIIIKVMSDVYDTFSDLLSNNPEVNKREFLIENVRKGHLISNSKTPWTEKRLKEAADKKIDQLYIKYSENPKDIVSRFAGVDSVGLLKNDLNKNFFMKELGGSLGSNFIPDITTTPAEQVGSYIYDKYGLYIAPISIFCTIFNHLDWEHFAKIAKAKRRKNQMDVENTAEIKEQIKRDLL